MPSVSVLMSYRDLGDITEIEGHRKVKLDHNGKVDGKLNARMCKCCMYSNT